MWISQNNLRLVVRNVVKCLVKIQCRYCGPHTEIYWYSSELLRHRMSKKKIITKSEIFSTRSVSLIGVKTQNFFFTIRPSAAWSKESKVDLFLYAFLWGLRANSFYRQSAAFYVDIAFLFMSIIVNERRCHTLIAYVC